MQKLILWYIGFKEEIEKEILIILPELNFEKIFNIFFFSLSW